MNLLSKLCWMLPLLMIGCQNAGSDNNGGTPAPPPDFSTPAAAWSNPATWGGTLPNASSSVTIPPNQRVVLDQDVKIKNLNVLGTLEFARKDLKLESDFIAVRGALRIGDSINPFKQKATITLTGSSTENTMNMGSRGILVMGGRLEIYGVTPNKVWTKLSDNAPANSSQLKLLDSVDWKSGDAVAIAPTDFFNGPFMNTPESELLEVGSVAGDTLGLKTPLQKARWGKLQYATETGMSLSPGAINLPPTTGRDTYGNTIPTVLDERAEVANLTRNIVIQSADDAAWQQDGFGAQVMVMDRISSLQLSGVELRRMGQAGKFGRYPIHFHNLSYDPSGKELGDVNYAVKNSVVWNSSQRCIVIHGSSGITLKDNICYDIKGHAIFMEDAVERRNVIEGNLVLKVRRPAKTQLLLKHEGEEGFGGTSSAFWIVNPDNTLRGNVAADIVGHGYWLAFPQTTLGVNNKVKLNAYVDDKGATVGARPDRMPFGVFENNTAHSIQDNGVFIDAVPTDARDANGNVAGETEGNKYIPMDGGRDWGYEWSKWQRFTLKGVTVYKTGAYWGGGGGIWNRNSNPNFLEWVSADHQGSSFAGAGDDGLIARSLVIGKSLNVGVPRQSTQPLAAVASYHSTFDMTQNVILEFPFVEGQNNDPAGAFMTGDYYITPVDKGLKRNPDNKLINASPGRRVQPFLNENWTLAGALWDANGYWGPAGNYWVYDQPFFTTGTSCQTVQPAGKNGSSCVGPYYGVGDYYTNFDTNRYSFKNPIEVTRVSNTGSSIGVWSVGDGNTAPKLGNMRHFAGVKGGRYVLRFPKRGGGGFEIPTEFSSGVDNFLSSNDSMLLGVSFTGGKTPTIKLGGTELREISTVGADLTAVQNDATGKTYWQDTSGNVVWVKLVGGFKPYTGNPDPNANENLYQSMRLEIK